MTEPKGEIVESTSIGSLVPIESLFEFGGEDLTYVAHDPNDDLLLVHDLCAAGGVSRFEVTPQNLEAYRELARAGVMYPLSGFMLGPEAVFRFTEEGWSRRNELYRSRFAPSAMVRRILRALLPMGNSVSGAS